MQADVNTTYKDEQSVLAEARQYPDGNDAK